jgi:SAM-dependent methyltransferase
MRRREAIERRQRDRPQRYGTGAQPCLGVLELAVRVRPPHVHNSESAVDARAAARRWGASNVEFVESEAERLPFPEESFDVVISNGVIDLIPDKEAVFSELFRVLAPGGHIQIADVTIQNPVSAEGRRNIDLWTG